MKVLLICQDNIGDLVFTTSLLEPLFNEYGNGLSIDVLTRSDTGQVAEFFPYVQHVNAQPSLARMNPITRVPSVLAFFEARRWIKKQQFDVAISVSKNWRLGALMYLAGVPKRIGFSYPKLTPWLTNVVPLPDPKQPVIEGLSSLLPTLGVYESASHYMLDMDKVMQARDQYLMNTMQKKHAEKRPWFGLHAFASQRNRCVPLSEWITLAHALIKQGMQPIWFGSPADMNYLREFHNSRTDIGYFCDQLCSGKLKESIPLLSLCDAYVGHDSGVLHLASAMGIKTLGIFTPGEPLRTFAQGSVRGMTLHRASAQDVDGALLIKETFECFSEYWVST